MTAARDRADRKGSTPVQIGSTKLATDSNNNLSVLDSSDAPKKLIASELEIGDSSNKVIIKKGSDNKVQFQTQASGGSAADSNAGGGVTIFANTTLLANATGTAVGDLGFVTANNKLYLRQSGGWYTVATVTNATPVISSAGNASYTFATDGTPIVITVSASDAEGETITYAHTVSSGSASGIATITQGTGGNVNQFTLTPATSGSGGNFSVTFTAQDPNGNTATSSASAFTLSFSTTDGSYYFAATDRKITSSTSSDFTMGTSTDFTVEFWYKATTISSSGYWFDMGSNTFTAQYFSSNTKIGIWNSSFSIQGGAGVGTSTNTWYHYVAQRSGSTFTCFIDGTSIGTSTTSHNLNQNSITLNNYGGGGSYGQTGYLSDFRVVKGTAVYSGNFSRPNGPLTLTGGSYPSNTNVNTSIPSGHCVLLTANHSSGSFDDDSNSNHTLTATGTVTPSAGVP